ncbi:sensor histidine kinase [Agromyces kandeliae]|uniref:histidine kinase n=1 Tax=Agromyces kandeliae TaxID=2666141 RepID=A0A6L5QZX4_9MICO|nr:ATP-binding protein [Agromyces kandeliae]MRX43366.1 HAMP domain-containing protein [Agromyces kandeliae]
MTHPGAPGYASAARRAASERARPTDAAGDAVAGGDSSAAGAGDGAVVRRRRAPQTLRRRLLFVIAALVVLVSAIVGLVSVASLHNQLMARMDAQLVQATDRAARTLGEEREEGEDHEDRVPLPPEGAEALLRIPGQPVGAIAALVTDRAVVTFGAIDEEGEFVDPPETIAPVLASVPADRTPVTVELDELGEYRAIAAPTDGGFSFVVAFPLTEVNATTAQLAVTVGVVAIAGLAAALVLGAVIVRRALVPLDRVTETATLVSELPLARGDVELPEEVPVDDERTEVGRLATSFNRMLGHVAASLSAREQSERKVRRFVADASHELRTPLASIRGYSELTRMHGGELPPDVVHALGRIESESLRMTELVEDLLLLARLDEGRELRREPVDLTRLVIDAVGDAQVAAPDHEWRVEVPDDEVTVTGDASRLHQVVANLLANARVHTPDGTEVVVRVARVPVASGSPAPARVRVTVTDDGPGIDPAVRASLFERFARGDASRSRRAGSTGLGLAIVKAVVTAHRGTVEVASEPGRTEFAVELPA